MGCTVNSTPMKAPLGAGGGSDSRKTSVTALSLQSNTSASNSPVPSSVDLLPLRSSSSGAPSPVDLHDAFSPTNDAASRGRFVELDKASVRLLEGAPNNPLEWDCRRHNVGTPHGSEDGSIVSCAADSETAREHDSTELHKPTSINGYNAIEPLTPTWLFLQQQHLPYNSAAEEAANYAARKGVLTRFQEWRASRGGARIT